MLSTVAHTITLSSGAIIRELEDEIGLQNTPEYQLNMHLLKELNYLIREVQRFLPDPTAVHFTEQWCTERKQVLSLYTIVGV